MSPVKLAIATIKSAGETIPKNPVNIAVQKEKSKLNTSKKSETISRNSAPVRFVFICQTTITKLNANKAKAVKNTGFVFWYFIFRIVD